MSCMYSSIRSPFAILSENINQLFFLVKIGSVFLSEFFIYCVFKDFPCFIERLSNKLASINILYVKLFQAFAFNNNLIDDKTNNSLLKFTDNAPWDHRDIDYDTLFDIGDEYELKFDVDQPINSGMISLVFKAHKVSNGDPVIIKIKRNNIEARLKESMNNILFCVDLFFMVPYFKKYNIKDSIHKTVDMILQQTNFVKEVENMVTMKNNCKHLQYVKIPYVSCEATQKYKNVILMEFIDGMTISKIAETDYAEFAKQVVKFGIVTFIMHGLSHGDLHAGNILFIKDDNDKEYPHKIGVIDFGIVYQTDPLLKSTFFEICCDLFTLTPEEITKKLIKTGMIEPVEAFDQMSEKNYNRIFNITMSVIKEAMDDKKSATQVQVYKFLNDLSVFLQEDEEIFNLGLRPNETFIKMQIVLAMAHGITLTLCKEDYLSVADKVINELFHTELLELE